MSVSFKAPMALAFLWPFPCSPFRRLRATAHDAGHKPAQHRVADFGEARA